MGYHGTTLETAEGLLAGRTFVQSANDYDWLGPGIYFWEANPKRALQFVQEKLKRAGVPGRSAVVEAVIEPGLCLDLATATGVEQIKRAYIACLDLFREAASPLPRNRGGDDLLMRHLDCAVIRTLHNIRSAAGDVKVDTVRGIFQEGGPVYENSGFYEKTHIQLCVCNPACIKGVFRVSDSELV